MNNKTDNHKNTLAADQKIVQGVSKYLAKASALTIAGVDYTPATLTAVFQGQIDALQALDAARAQLTQQVANNRAMQTPVNIVRKGLKSYLLGTYGTQAITVLDDFGMSAPKATGPKTTQTKANAIVKILATRKARNTMGKKQKLSVVGAPTGTVDLKALAEAPKPPPSPAASAPATANGASSVSSAVLTP